MRQAALLAPSTECDPILGGPAEQPHIMITVKHVCGAKGHRQYEFCQMEALI
jgi:hypothetical protein